MSDTLLKIKGNRLLFPHDLRYLIIKSDHYSQFPPLLSSKLHAILFHFYANCINSIQMH